MNKIPFSVPLSLALIFLIIANIAFADRFYKWKDKNGVVHFGDRVDYIDTPQVDVKVNHNVDQHYLQRNNRRVKSLKAYEQDEKEKAEKQAEQSSEEAKKRIRCARVKKAQQGYKSAQQLYKKDKSGNKTMLSPEQHKKALNEVSNYISKWCS